jgi:uncharacterized protein with PIN domain
VARRLRLAGVDAAYINDIDDDTLVEQANHGRRVLLTQDRGLLCRRKLWLGAYVRGARPDEQFRDVLDRFAPALAPWTRLHRVQRAAVTGAQGRRRAGCCCLAPGVRTRRSHAAQPVAGLYWRGAHSTRLEGVVESAIRAVSAAGRRRRR